MRALDVAIGLIGAAIIAVFVTAYAAATGMMVVDIVNGASLAILVELANPLGWFSILFFSVVFGLPGALLFLAIAFFLCRRFGYAPKRYALFGLLAGLVHAGVALSLRSMIGTDITGTPLDDVLIWGGGFGLGLSPRWEISIVLIPSSILAGWLAGQFFARWLRPRSDRLVRADPD